MFQYDLWTDDSNRTLALAYGSVTTSSAFAAGRVTRLIDENGDTLLEYNTLGGLATHPQKVLEDCQALFGP